MTNEAVSQELTTLLYEDEKVVWQGKPNRKGLVLDTVFKMLPILLIWLALDSVFIGIMIAEDVFKENPHLSYIVLPFFIIHIAPLWIWISNIMKASAGYKTYEYVLTQKRVIIKTEIYGVDVRIIWLNEIKQFKVVKDTVDRMLNTGDLIIKGENIDVALVNIKNAEDVRKSFNEVLEVNKENM